jgi:hypothetical protein
MSKHVVIINYAFPPNNGIGGRRWAKIAKYLLKNKFNVTVVCRKPDENTFISSWSKDVKDLKRIYLNLKYPKVLTKAKLSIIDKILYRIWFFILKMKVKGNYFDVACMLEKQLLQKLTKINSENKIDTLIISGAPFNLLYIGAKFKKEHPRIRVICDYRDPWISAQNNGMKSISEDRLKIEIKKQNLILETVDFITAPNSFMLDQIKNEYTGTNYITSRFYTLQHSFDIDDYTSVINSQERKHKLKFSYAGTLYQGCEDFLLQFKSFISFIKEANIDFEVNFYTNETDMKKEFREFSQIYFNKPLGSEIFNKLNESDFLLIFLAEHNKDFCTTKFFEYLPLRKPYLYFGPEGNVSNTIVKNNIGYIATGKSTEDIFYFIQNGKISTQDINNFSLENVSTNFIKEVLD